MLLVKRKWLMAGAESYHLHHQTETHTLGQKYLMCAVPLPGYVNSEFMQFTYKY